MKGMRFSRNRLLLVMGSVALFVLYLVTRLTNLTALPIFTDEAIYIRWSQIGAADPNWRFISLTDGKQPMFTWIMMVLLRVFASSDPLFVGRLTSVFAGACTLLGLLFVAHVLFSDKKVTLLTGLTYVLLPFTLWYDRMALYDSWVAAFSVWSLYGGIMLVRTLRLDAALLLGVVLGAGMLNKSSGFLSYYMLPLSLLLFDWKSNKRMKRLVRWVMLAAVAGIFSQVFYSVLRLSAYFHMVGLKNNVFLFSMHEWFDQPFRFTTGNLRGMFDWLWRYMTLPVFLAATLPLFSRWKKMPERLLLYGWWFGPFYALANFAKILYPRFILFMAIPLIPLAAHSLVGVYDKVTNPSLKRLIVIVFFVPLLWISFGIVTNPERAHIVAADRGQFIDDWPAGGGVRETVAYLSAQAAQADIHVYTEGTFGLMPYAIEIYLVNNPHVKITGIWPLPEDIPDEIVKETTMRRTFLILNETQEAPKGWPLTLIGEYEKGNGSNNKKLRFYRIQAPIAQAR